MVEAAEGYHAVRHCLHAAKVTVPLGLLLGQYSEGTVSDGGNRMDALLGFLQSSSTFTSGTSTDEAASHIQSLHAFDSQQQETNALPVASLVLDAIDLAQFNSAVVQST